MLKSEILTKIYQELTLGESARQKGNEGMARVCARRAAGLAARACLEKMGVDIHKLNSLDALQVFSRNSDFPASIRRSAELLTMRVTPEHHLPIEVDLLQEARNFIQKLDCWMED